MWADVFRVAFTRTVQCQVHRLCVQSKAAVGEHCRKHFGFIMHLIFELSFHYCLFKKSFTVSFFFSWPHSVTWLHMGMTPHSSKSTCANLCLNLFSSTLNYTIAHAHSLWESTTSWVWKKTMWGAIVWQENYGTLCKVTGNTRTPHLTSPSPQHSQSLRNQVRWYGKSLFFFHFKK